MIYIASDHAGFELKKALVEHLRAKGHEVGDVGAYQYNEQDDYPDFIYPCAAKVAYQQAQGKSNVLGIAIGGSGQGEAIVANKVKGIRATVYYGGNLDIIKLSKEHNNANVLSLGARFLTVDQAEEAVDLWLETKFSSESRHLRRIQKIKKIENGSL